MVGCFELTPVFVKFLVFHRLMGELSRLSEVNVKVGFCYSAELTKADESQLEPLFC